MSQELVIQDEKPLTAYDIKNQVQLIQEVMKEVMSDGQHYGKIPGCGDKPTLLKPGAEKLSMTFRLAPRYEITMRDVPHEAVNGHREYEIICSLYHIKTGAFWGSGVGVASTMESKWRYRTGPVKLTDKPVPKDYWECRKSDPGKATQLLGGRGYSAKKNDAGVWVIAEGGERVENDNPADLYNTVKKMAKKRAHIDAVLTATAASDIFAQDLEEIHDEVASVVDTMPTTKQESKPVSTPMGEQTPVTITRVEVKKGKSQTGKPWTKYEITDSAGQVYSTFSESMSEAAQQAVDTGCPVSIKSTPWEANGKQGKNLDILDFLPAEAKETTTQVRQPASPELQKKILDAVDKVVQFPPWMGAEEALREFSVEEKDGKKISAKDFSHLFSSEKWAQSCLVKMQAFLIKAEAEAGGGK